LGHQRHLLRRPERHYEWNPKDTWLAKKLDYALENKIEKLQLDASSPIISAPGLASPR